MSKTSPAGEDHSADIAALSPSPGHTQSLEAYIVSYPKANDAEEAQSETLFGSGLPSQLHFRLRLDLDHQAALLPL
jgi:hypothetical protein